MTIQEAFQQSFLYFQENSETILKKYRGKIIAIHLNKVLGEYESKTKALLSVPKEFGIEAGSFLIKDCSEATSNTVRLYQSRVNFSQ